jgi:TolB-like protein
MESVKLFLAEEINDQIKRILNSPGFRNSPALSRFLTFVVSEVKLGHQQQIKEYSIAVNVLNRPPDFKPQDDAVVRIHAGRLRRALSEYYLIEGINDPLIIHIPKGGYIPRFKGGSVKTTEPEMPMLSVHPAKPVFAIFPFRTMPKSPDVEEFASVLCEQLGAELSRSHRISVLGYFSKEMTEKIKKNILEAGRASGADYVVTGSLQYHDQSIRVTTILITVTTGEVMTGEIFEKPVESQDLFKIQDEIVNTMVRGISMCCAFVP